MHSKIRIYVEELFDDVERTKEVIELREEILQNGIDKYEDLCAEGKTEDEAYKSAISSIGDIHELLQSIGVEFAEKKRKNGSEEEPFLWESTAVSQKQNVELYTYMRKEEKKYTLLLVSAIMLYILSVVPVMFADYMGGDLNETMGICFMFLFIALATGLVVYYAKTKPKKRKQPEGYEENNEQNNSRNNLKHFRNENDKRAYKSISSALWSVMIALYFIISFWTMAWHITWVMFLIADALNSALRAWFEMRKE